MQAPTRWRLPLVALLGAALVLSGCRSEPADPQERLNEAIERTFTDSFSYRASAQADRAALANLGEGAAQAAAFLNTFALAGVVHDDGVSLDVHLVVADPVIQLRRFGDEELYLRLGLLDLPLQLEGPTRLEQDLLAIAEQENLPDSVSQGIEALFAGSWVGVIGEFDPARLGVGTPDDVSTPNPTRAPTGGLPGILDAYMQVTQEVTDDGEARYDVDLQLRELLRGLAAFGAGAQLGGASFDDLESQLAELPETVAGRVDTRDGYVTAVRFDVAEAARAAGNDVAGEIVLRLDIDDPGDTTPPEVPADHVTVPSDDLAAGLDQLLAGLQAGS